MLYEPRRDLLASRIMRFANGMNSFVFGTIGRHGIIVGTADGATYGRKDVSIHNIFRDKLRTQAYTSTPPQTGVLSQHPVC